MDKILLAVNRKGPMMGAMRKTMRFVGLTEVASFVASLPDEGAIMRAWLTEIRFRSWDTAGSLLADYPNADISRPPHVVFYLGDNGLRIETIIQFRAGIVFLTQIHHPALAVSYLS
jgi:mRNA-degrading endonuclease HigB of HigAB toxin-antitoxin module